MGKGESGDFCFGSGVVTTLVTRHSVTRTLTNVFCFRFHLFITDYSPLRVRAASDDMTEGRVVMLSVLVTCDADSDVSVVCALLHHVDKTDTEPETGNTLGARPPETRGPGGECWAATPGGGGRATAGCGRREQR